MEHRAGIFSWWWEEEEEEEEAEDGIVGVGCSTGAEMDHLAGAISGNKTSTLRGRTADSSGLACGSPLFIFHVMETLAAVMTKPLSIKHT